MRRRGALLVILACAVAACLAVAGCGGRGASGGDGKGEDPSGWWRVESATSPDGDITADDLDLARTYGMDFILYLAEDGTGKADAFGEVTTLTWDAGARTVTAEGSTMDLEVKDGKLILSDGDSSFTFVRGDDPDSLADQMDSDENVAQESTEGATSQAQSQPIDPVISVADDENFKIEITGKAVDEFGDAGYTVRIENRTDRSVTAWVPADKTSVDGTMDELNLFAGLTPGATSTEFAFFSDIDTIEGLANVKTTISVFDTDTFDDIASYDVTIP